MNKGENIINYTEQLYDESAAKWVRTSPKSFSDFIARPAALLECIPLTNKVCLDIGCGEGYFSRLLATSGAKKVVGIDLSSEMIKRANELEKSNPLEIQYHVGDITKPLPFQPSSIDLVTAIFVFNYLTVEGTTEALKNIKEVLCRDGCLLFVVPHPFLLRTWKHTAPFYFGVQNGNYYEDRNKKFEGKIFTIDGRCFDVLNCHKTFEDYFNSLYKAGLNKIELVKELTVTKEQLHQNPSFYSGTVNQPFFLLVKAGVVEN